jgi:biopolymer transport protein ExbD
MRIDLGDDEQPEISLIALIDCIFFLLMFFMVATSFKQVVQTKPTKELPVILPTSQASLERVNASASPLIIGVGSDGQIYLGGDEVSTQALHDRLKKEAAKNPQRPIRIDGDQLAKYQDIVHVLDLCQFEGFTQIAMHTRQ